MKIPFIKIKQKGEIFYITKLNAFDIRENIIFNFRDPYLEYKSPASYQKYYEYIEKNRKLGLELGSSSEGIQRRIQTHRMQDIKNYIESNESNFFPSSVLLSADVTKFKNFEDYYLKYEEKEIGEFELPDDILFTVIDGQHRLAGLFLCDNKILKNFEIVAVLLFNISLSTAAKLFADINGKQKPVNRSLVYDLRTEIDTVIEIDVIKKFHLIAQKFYTDVKSPLYRQIKMLGIGKGAVSQSFFIDHAIDAAKKAFLKDAPVQEIYNQFFYYFRTFQKIFPKDWPVPIDHNNDFDYLDEYADNILRKRKSQLAKTNGFGAILKLFPDVYKSSDKDFESYYNILQKLSGKIDWVPKPEDLHGTGEKIQWSYVDKMKKIIFN